MNKLKDISTWLYRRIGIKTVIISTIVFISFMVIVLPRVSETTKEITNTSISPDTSFFYTAEDLYQMAGLYGEEGRNYYIRSRVTFDIIWPLVYLFFLVSALTLVFKYLDISNKINHLNLLPFFGVLFDFLENTGASIIMYRYPLRTPILSSITPMMTMIKWLSIYASFIILLAGIVIMGKRKFLGKI